LIGKKPVSRVEVVEIGDFPAGFLDAVCERVARELGLGVVRAGVRLDPSFAYDERREQFQAGRLLEKLRHAADSSSLVVGVASVDLFNPVLTFVFGEAEMPGRAAVFSTYRLREEFYGLPPDGRLLLERAVKEFLHEAGHTMGLPHCNDYACVMSPSHSVEAVDLKAPRMCEECAARVAGARAPGPRGR
jgi:archaemetzincin